MRELREISTCHYEVKSFFNELLIELFIKLLCSLWLKLVSFARIATTRQSEAKSELLVAWLTLLKRLVSYWPMIRYTRASLHGVASSGVILEGTYADALRQLGTAKQFGSLI
jgi:hypothetical protein